MKKTALKDLFILFGNKKSPGGITKTARVSGKRVKRSFSIPGIIIRGQFILFLLITPALSVGAEELNDPLEGFNRTMFEFNDTLDAYVLEPVSRTYRDNVPNEVRTGIGNFFLNLGYPIYLLSDLTQLKFKKALDHSFRFAVNSTVGILGFIDVAAEAGVEHEPEDFGQALGYWGVPSGPYIVLPFFGPSNVRDAFGRIVDASVDPLNYVADLGDLRTQTRDVLAVGLNATDLVQSRAELLRATDSAKETSTDYYIFVQSSYNQLRKSLIQDGEMSDDNFEDDDFEEDNFEEDEEFLDE